MTTTDMFQKQPNFYMSEQECKNHNTKRVGTNPRYKYYNQTQFTAGDEEQFEFYRFPFNNVSCVQEISLNKNIFEFKDELIENIDFEKYKDINPEIVTQTFRYIFNKFKKGIFVKIQNNELKVFLPFSKHKYINEWGDLIEADPKYGKGKRGILELIKKAQTLEGREYNEKRVNGFPRKWYGNNCIFRYEFPVSEGDSGVSVYKDFLLNLCKNRKLPDIEFFINRRDFPLLTKDGTEPYESIFGKVELLSHSYEKYCPIFSGSISENNADILLPTWEDWERVSSQTEGKFFPKNCRNYNYAFNTPWEEKKPTAVFRGSTTGCGTTIDTNMRLKVSFMATTPINKSETLIDAGITKWNLRPRKSEGNKYLDTIDITKLPFKLVSKLSPEEQSKYKYIINIDGHVSAYRLSLEMQMGCVILLVESKYKIWFHKYLKEGIHYIKVKKDLSDLFQKVRWCRENDDLCRQIAKNALDFYNTYLSKEALYDYMQKVLVETKKTTGSYLYNSLVTSEFSQYTYEEDTPVEETSDKYYKVFAYGLPPSERCYSLLEGIKLFMDNINYQQRYKNLKFVKSISNKDSKRLDLYNFAGEDICVIKSGDAFEMMYEKFIGIKGVNNLLKYIPNFCYTFGSINEEILRNPDSEKDNFSVILEYIDGITFEDYLKSPQFNFKTYVWILMQLSLALQIAQDKIGFVSYDLYPWNIMLKKISRSYDYIISLQEIYRLETDIVPIIIDYGNSSFIYNGKHYGNPKIQQFRKSPVQDILTIILSSLKIIINNKSIGTDDIKNIVKLSNYISNTKYTKYIKFGNVYDIRKFLEESESYTDIISSDKYELEDRTPLEFFKFLKKEFYSSGVIKTYPKDFIDVKRFDIGNPTQVFEYICSSTHEERVDSYLQSMKKVLTKTIARRGVYFMDTYVYTMLKNNIEDNFELLRKYTTLNEEIEKTYVRCVTFLEYLYSKNTPKEELIKYEKVEYPKKFEVCPYNIYSFTSPETMRCLIELYKSQPNIPNYLEYRNIVEFILLFSTMPSSNKLYYTEMFENLLSMKPFVVSNYIANKDTFVERLRLSLSYDMGFMENSLLRCDEYKKLYNVYTKLSEIEKKIKISL